jgi:glycosyltransferase involved in cell wall biosynthesis
MPILPSVCCIVPVHGESPWLEEALDSVLRQQPAPEEVVVVDDGSPEPVSLPERHEERVRVVRRDERGGPAAARDAGLAATEAPLVALCDADDAWLLDKLAPQLAALERWPAAAVCFGRAEVVGPDGRPSGERWEEPPAGVQDPVAFARLLYERNPIPLSSAVVRRAALVEAGGFAGPAPLASDWDLWLRLAGRGCAFACEPAARVLYRRHPAGVTADVATLAESQLALHERHAALVDEATRRRVRAADLTGLARGLVRRRDYAGARAALREAGALAPLDPRERALAAALAIPGARAALGRRDPYR